MNHFDKIKSFVLQIIDGTDAFIVMEQNAVGNAYKFFIDADTSFDIKRCVSTTRQLRKRIEDEGLHPEGDFTLEISSPGLDEPLKQVRQYIKNIERLIEIKFHDTELKPIIGRLKTVTEDAINIEVIDKKKKTTTSHEILWQNIKQATIQIEF